MEIKDFVNCDTDNVLPKESKMVLNLLLSGNENQIYSYKDISDEIYRKYNTYIRFNRLDRFSKDKNNVAKRDVGYYSGEINKICCKLGFPLLSVNIVQKNSNLAGKGFFDLCDELNVAMDKPKKDRIYIIRTLISEHFEEIKEQLPRYINEELDITDIKPIIKKEFQAKEEISEIYNKYYEGNYKEQNILCRTRNSEVVIEAKTRDKYTCQACGFNYKKFIVEAHHLKPLADIDKEHIVSRNDLVTLCPTCHSLAHLLLKTDKKFENTNILINGLKEILKSNGNN